MSILSHQTLRRARKLHSELVAACEHDTVTKLLSYAEALETERDELLRFVRYAAENSERGFERAWDAEPYEVFEKALDLAERFKEVEL